MKHKLLLIFLGLGLCALIGGFLLWKYYQKPTSESTPTVTTKKTASPVPEFPKVTNWQVPILMYHYIRDASGESQLGKNLSVHPKNFELHLKWLQENNYESLTLADLADPEKKVLSKIIGEKKKPIVITFDDGYQDAYINALPILEKYKMTATFYIIRNYVGKAEYMNQEQINNLEKAGFEIGSHTLSHPDLTKLTTTEAQKQIFDSREKAITFCYPAGKYDATTVSLVQQAGYQMAVTTHFGIANQGSSVLELPRVRVEEGSGEVLGDKISAAYEQSKN